MADSANPDQLALVQGLFVQHLPALRGFVLSLVSDYSLVDDVVQETFLVVSAKAGEFQRGSNFRAWAWTIARYKVLQTLQKTPKAEQRLSDEVIESLCATEASEEWPAEEQLHQLAECVRELAPRARQAVELRYQQAHKPPEIARLMGWTVDAVHVALSRARVTLRECVQRRTATT
ncbi:MAG: RNA polymerase sigma-E factor [Limisphaerales bacterium]|nr:MAG: RNA polymerase sigma-E factor [Limisphaerales bacterium]KAG0508757.1 MAG: RNA polymerase sigma-E factor [Limisphaerales bacterium]TXT50552.1 MAG: RNA polymerase sigma-E factor [Limisphaerales bacterium]